MRNLLCGVLLVASVIALNAQSAPPAKPLRINRAIQMLEQGQPVYYTQTNGGGYEEGKKLAHTPSDYITYDMEHGAYDMSALRAFMRGLVDGGPTPTGHRTPAVIVTLPVLGLDEASMRANYWVIFFLNSCNDKNVVDMIKEGVMICTGGYEVGRKFTNKSL